MFVTDYEIKKFHVFKEKFLYLLKLNKELYAVVINGEDDTTTLNAITFFDYASALHQYNEWRKSILEKTFI